MAKSISHPKIDQRRGPLYIWLLVCQSLSLFSNVFLVPASRTGNYLITEAMAAWMDLFFSLSLTTVSLFFLYHFINKRWFFYVLATALTLATIVIFIATISGLEKSNFDAYRIILGFSTTITLIMIFTSFYEAVTDVFGERLKIRDALLGAANIFLLIIILFTFIYAVMGIVVPNSVVADANISKLYNTCYIHSGYVVASMDVPDNNFASFVKNSMAIESMFTHLFEVMIIGRLLSKV
jgi:hypothetical protein